MKIDIPYLDKTFPLEFPDKNLLSVCVPNDYKTSGTTEEILEAALANPAGGGSFESFISGGKKFLIIINDATRPTPTEAILKCLTTVFKKAGVGNNQLTLLVATGAHRVPTEAEYHQLLGVFYDELRPRTLAHDCRKAEDMVDLGKTRNGTPIKLNKHLFEADRIIATGSVEPHYFAGFTGGRKAFLPGVASYETIEANHKQALQPGSHLLALEGNPVHEDMMDALPLIKAPVFSFMTVLDKEQHIASASAGDLMQSFYQAVETAKKIFCVKLPERADVVVTVAKFPMDINLYQAQKAIENGSQALKDGGTLILVASCRDGIGDEAFARLLAQASSPGEVLKLIDKGYKLGYHKAAHMAAVSGRATVRAVTELSKERLASMFIEANKTPQEALDLAMEKVHNAGVKEPKIVVLPDGTVTVPEV
jgi:nickel-dependent lactate racemase